MGVGTFADVAQRHQAAGPTPAVSAPRCDLASTVPTLVETGVPSSTSLRLPSASCWRSGSSVAMPLTPKSPEKVVPDWVARMTPEARAKFDAIDWDKEDESWVEDGTTYVVMAARRKAPRPSR